MEKYSINGKLAESTQVVQLDIVGEVPSGVLLSEYRQMAQDVIDAAQQHQDLEGIALVERIYGDLAPAIYEDYECGNKSKRDDWERMTWEYAQWVASKQ